MWQSCVKSSPSTRLQAHRHLRGRVRLAHGLYVLDLRDALRRRDSRDEAQVSDRKKVVILGGGPNRIGQGIEFDYCCCHAAFALRDAGYEAIMINCNPETVSTDYDTSDRLYFEPLTAEDVLEILRAEQAAGTLTGVIVQFGGQTPLKLAHALEKAGIPILGTSPDAIDLAEDRDRFQKLLMKLDLAQPKNGIAYSVEQARLVAGELGFPLVVRPSYVLGGRAMQIIHSESALQSYLLDTVPGLVPEDIKQKYPNDKTGQINTLLGKNPLLFDTYLSGAIEVDVDCLSDGRETLVAGIMEHIEEAGIHSGDSACSLPVHTLTAETVAELERQTTALAKALNVGGLMNVQFAIQNGEIFILEVNPRASRTVPFVAKTIGKPIAKIAARVMAGETLDQAFAHYGGKPDGATRPHIAVKEAVFPFARFPGVDTLLGPEMRSTGEVMGLDYDYALAFAKAQLGAGVDLPRDGTLFVSVRDSDKPGVLPAVKRLSELGFRVLATGGTQRFLAENGVTAEKINKVLEGRPHIEDAIRNRQVQIVFNTTDGQKAVSELQVTPPRNPDAESALLHHAFGRCRRRRSHRRPQSGQPRSAPAAGVFLEGEAADLPPSGEMAAGRRCLCGRRQALSLFPPPQLLAHASGDAQPVFVEVAPGVFFFNSGGFLGSRPMPRARNSSVTRSISAGLMNGGRMECHTFRSAIHNRNRTVATIVG